MATTIGTATRAPATQLADKFDFQVNTLVERGYAKLAGLSNDEFAARLAPLRQLLATVPAETVDFAEGRLPFVIVVTSAFVAVQKTVGGVIWGGNPLYVNLDPNAITDYQPTDAVQLPNGDAYVLVGIDRGRETLNVPPADAIKTLQRDGRSPLTIAEGIAILTHYPAFLLKNNCFSLLGSRAGDRTVPALWISQGRPRLGWCWEGAPHTWLGSASCAERVGLQ